MMEKTKKILANTFIVIVLMMMIRPHLPESKFLSIVFHPIYKIELSMGINQSWLMFSPNPSKLDAYVIGVVEYGDGTMDSFDFNKGLEMNMLRKYLYGEKYRKFTSEHLRVDKKSYLWSDGADFALRKLSEKNPGRIPRKVTLTRYWHETPDWNTYFTKHGEPKTKYSSFIFYKRVL